MTGAGLTLDVDWAPDVVIDNIAGRLVAANVRATWFVTHASPAVNRLREHPYLFELGIHPNFLPGSTHGNSTVDVLAHCQRLVPDAISMRSHAVFQYGRLYGEVLRNTNVRIDSTTFLPEMEHVRVLDQPTPAGILKRVPFIWADDYELAKPEPKWELERFNDRIGLQVFMFHPIHVYLNTPSPDHYERLRTSVSFEPATPSVELAQHVHQGAGVAGAFESLTSRLAVESGGFLIRDLL